MICFSIAPSFQEAHTVKYRSFTREKQTLVHKPGHLRSTDPLEILMQVFNEISSRDMEKIDVFRGILQNYVFVAVLSCTVFFQIIIIQFLGEFANTTPLTPLQWFISVFIGFLGMPIAAVVKLIPVGSN